MSRDLSVVGRALAAPARSTFLNLLMDGSTRPASELASAAGVRASTASEHLTVLVDAGLVVCVPRGRQRFYAIADPAVAAALEQLGQLCPPMPISSYGQSSAARRLATARLCYDHLAGRLGIALTGAMIDAGWISPELDAVTDAGAEQLERRGIRLDELRRARRVLARPCPDWTERKPHLAGAVGAAIAAHLLAEHVVARAPSGRGLTVTALGRTALARDWHTRVEDAPA